MTRTSGDVIPCKIVVESGSGFFYPYLLPNGEDETGLLK